MKKIKNGKVVGFFGLGIAMGIVMLVAFARLSWHGEFYPGVTIAGIELAGLTREQAEAKLTEAIDNYQITLTFNGSSWKTPKGAIKTELAATLSEAYRYGRRLKIEDYFLLLINKKTNYPIVVAEGETDDLTLLINEIAGEVEITPVEPTVQISGDSVRANNGADGTMLDQALLYKRIEDGYRTLGVAEVEVPTHSALRILGSDQLEQLKTRAEALQNKSLSLTLDDVRVNLGPKELVSLLATDGQEEMINQSAIDQYVTGLQQSLDKPPQEAKFEMVAGRVKEFAPSKEGDEVIADQTASALRSGIEKLIKEEVKTVTVPVMVNKTAPQVTMDKVNELGINELIGRGESYYAHSIPNRIFNVGLAASRANAALVASGQEFSFNNVVGDISAASGYREGYIISGGRTVLGDGGGVCQVSTTLFRAALNAGLPITERWGHAYRVGYYEQNSKPGIDATVFAPSKDLKFKNDTPGYILVQTINDPKNLHLVVEIYGTKDGRVATISDPKVWGITPPLPTIYQDDPTLPTGSTKQVDWAASGAKTSFEYKVMRGGEVLENKTFTTTYQSWASVFLRGTGI